MAADGSAVCAAHGGTWAREVVMVRPACFGFNAETAVDNGFQHASVNEQETAQAALAEFDAVVRALREAGVGVTVLEDERDPCKPDAVFPNNWFCSMPDGRLHVFAMKVPVSANGGAPTASCGSKAR